MFFAPLSLEQTDSLRSLPKMTIPLVGKMKLYKILNQSAEKLIWLTYTKRLELKQDASCLDLGSRVYGRLFKAFVLRLKTSQEGKICSFILMSDVGDCEASIPIMN